MKSDKFHEQLKDNFSVENTIGLLKILSSRNLSRNQVDYIVKFIININEYQYIRIIIENRYIYLEDEHYCEILRHAIQRSQSDEYFGYTYSTIFSCVMRVKDIGALLDMYGSLDKKEQQSSFGVYVFQRIILRTNRFFKNKRGSF
jgi:hypothetical protein